MPDINSAVKLGANQIIRDTLRWGIGKFPKYNNWEREKRVSQSVMGYFSNFLPYFCAIWGREGI